MNKNAVASELIKIAKDLLSQEDPLAGLETMRINDIAHLIRKNWSNVNYGAKPYLDAMGDINSNGEYGMDDWTSIVAYFLSNATTWRGEVAKVVKKELNKRLKSKKMNG